MIRQDYIIRLIEQLGVLFSRVLNKNASTEEIDANIDSLFDEWIGLPQSMLLALPAGESYRLFDESGRMVTGKCFLLAEVCRARGLMSDEGEARAGYFEKALFFYDKCSGCGDEELLAEIHKNVSALKAELG
jgi:hypothetical protein